MPVLARSKARVRQPLAHAASSRASSLGWASASSSELSQQPSLEGGVSRSDRAFGGCLSTLAVGSERPLAVHTCRADVAESILPLILNPIKFTATFKIISIY